MYFTSTTLALGLDPSTTMSAPLIKLLRLSRFPIYHQLVLEEALLRSTKDNWMIINDGAFNPAIVMGISG